MMGYFIEVVEPGVVLIREDTLERRMDRAQLIKELETAVLKPETYQTENQRQLALRCYTEAIQVLDQEQSI